VKDENAYDSIRINREFDSNEIDESELQPGKHSNPRMSTFRGISIELIDDSEKVDDSISVNFESSSKWNESTLSDSSKQSAVNLVIDRGIHTRRRLDRSALKIDTISTEPSVTIYRRMESNPT
jgi:hypothetical protein